MKDETLKMRNLQLLGELQHLKPVLHREFIMKRYETIKREPKIRGINKCRCDERLQTKTKEFTRLPYTGLVESCLYIGPALKKQNQFTIEEKTKSITNRDVMFVLEGL